MRYKWALCVHEGCLQHEMAGPLHTSEKIHVNTYEITSCKRAIKDLGTTRAQYCRMIVAA